MKTIIENETYFPIEAEIYHLQKSFILCDVIKKGARFTQPKHPVDLGKTYDLYKIVIVYRRNRYQIEQEIIKEANIRAIQFPKCAVDLYFSPGRLMVHVHEDPL